jgi:hypothetical protein
MLSQILQYSRLTMKVTPTFSRRARILFHTLGLSCLGGAIFLQTLTLAGIMRHGYFMAVEQNPAVLAFEVTLTAFALIYFVYICQRLIRSVG